MAHWLLGFAQLLIISCHVAAAAEAPMSRNATVTACIAKRSADPAEVGGAVAWACAHMPRFNCSQIPETCDLHHVDPYKTADYVFSVYHLEVGDNYSCDFGGVAYLREQDLWPAEVDPHCVATEDPSPAQACMANRDAEPSAIGRNIDWACSHMPRFFCTGIPTACDSHHADVYKTADYVFSVWYLEVGGDPKVHCNFAGAALMAPAEVWKKEDSECIALTDPNPPDRKPPTQALPAPSTVLI